MLCLVVLLSSCSNYQETNDCKRSFIMSSVLELSRTMKSKQDKDGIAFTMCVLSELYKEDNETIDRIYDSFDNGDDSILKAYIAKQKYNCSKDRMVNDLNMNKILENALEAKEFTEKHINKKCSKLLGKKIIMM